MKVQVTEDDILVPTEMLAKIYDVSTRTVNLWTKSGCPKEARGAYSLKAVAKWFREGAPGEQTDVENLSLAQQKIYYEGQHRAALAELQQMKLAAMKGELLPAAKITEDLRRFCGVLKKELQATGREVVLEIAADVPAERVRQIDKRITERINNALRQMSAGDFRCEEE